MSFLLDTNVISEWVKQFSKRLMILLPRRRPDVRRARGA